jgi:glycosyltransferase involved in cell wall biosynthesis
VAGPIQYPEVSLIYWTSTTCLQIEKQVLNYAGGTRLWRGQLQYTFMKIAILGTRGIPARYGGFETFAEQISRRLAERGHKVTVYCRRPFTRADDEAIAGVHRKILPSISTKYFDTFSHTFLSILHVISTDSDVVLLCNVANSPFAWIPRLFGKPVILNIDGLDRKRRKWGPLGRLYLSLCEMIAVVAPTRLVTDAQVIQEYYSQRYGKRSTMIAYGAEVPVGSDDPGGDSLPSKPYILYVSRLEPENNPEIVIRAYRKVETDWPLVIVGGNPYDGSFVSHLKSISDPRVVFTGPVYGQGYWQLQRNAGLYVCASEVGGTHPGLVEAMAAQNAIIYLDTPENRETVSECGIPFGRDLDDLAVKLRTVIGNPDLRSQLGFQARHRAQTIYGWQGITQKYETLMLETLGQPNLRVRGEPLG